MKFNSEKVTKNESEICKKQRFFGVFRHFYRFPLLHEEDGGRNISVKGDYSATTKKSLMKVEKLCVYVFSYAKQSFLLTRHLKNDIINTEKIRIKG